MYKANLIVFKTPEDCSRYSIQDLRSTLHQKTPTVIAPYEDIQYANDYKTTRKAWAVMNKLKQLRAWAPMNDFVFHPETVDDPDFLRDSGLPIVFVNTKFTDPAEFDFYRNMPASFMLDVNATDNPDLQRSMMVPDIKYIKIGQNVYSIDKNLSKEELEEIIAMHTSLDQSSPDISQHLHLLGAGSSSSHHPAQSSDLLARLI